VPSVLLTFMFPGLKVDSIGYHWTQDCGNDVVEGGFYQTSLLQPISAPEPAAGLSLVLGLLGFAGAKRTFKKQQALFPFEH
ncbi:MAG: PEP-CTERM sorting domain-containing protein, partial [Syntrophales bacterium LBB04]|nr:PEP-CTERM sorting domain-containing protein [Syntrophales bacterium LBB04]